MGFVMFISINDFFKDFVRDNYDLVKGSELLIISRDIVANGDSVESELPFEDATSTSRYESITFVPDLVPNASVMEYSHGSTRDMFYKAYMEQLSTKSSSKSSSGDSIDMKDTISLLKDMRGLDNDVSQVTSQLIQSAKYESLFGSGDPTVAYYKNLNLINKVIESKEEYKNAYD